MNLSDDISSPALRRPNTILGIGLMLGSTLAFAAMHACIRHVSANVHPFEAAFFRYLFGGLVLVPMFFQDGFSPLRTERLGLHAVRGTVQAFQGLLSFLAVTLAPLAKVTAVQFTAPLFTTLAAVLILKERVSCGRVLALLIGFAGTWIIIRPGLATLDTGVLSALLSAVFLAANIILVKLLARTETSVTITMYQTLVTTPICLVFALFDWTVPTLPDLGWLFLLGTFGTIAHICLAEACKVADVTTLLPFDYMRLVWAGLLGYLLFFEIPDQWTVLGGTVIFVCGLYLLFCERPKTRENKRKKDEQRSRSGRTQ
ncbi:MAG: RNA polymerase subunit sigma-54 [Magnetovibrio sp.]|nr:RNA polymerase subunit sigma-54 [Magnetovibrio sp.]|tara:strand:- start:16 stop:960 length:945 start_codon:yes stop_codon:yes gene_type:complete